MLKNKYKRINGRFVIINDTIPTKQKKIYKSFLEKKAIKQKRTYRILLEEKTYIYGLFSPILNKYFYVGQTKDPEKRFHRHKLNKDNNTNKKYHITLLKDKGLMFRMDILAEITTDLIKKWENAYIKHLRQLNHPLTNRENNIEVEANDIITNEYIETLIMLDDYDCVSEKTKQNINFLLNYNI